LKKLFAVVLIISFALTACKNNAANKLDISQAVAEAEIPNLIGVSFEDAQRILKEKNLNYRVEFEASKETRNLVFEQANAETEVVLKVSLGWFPKEIKTPNFVGLFYANALELAENNDLTLELQYEVSAEPQGTNLSQDVSVGTVVWNGTAISVTVSNGSQT